MFLIKKGFNSVSFVSWDKNKIRFMKTKKLTDLNKKKKKMQPLHNNARAYIYILKNLYILKVNISIYDNHDKKEIRVQSSLKLIFYFCFFCLQPLQPS